MRIFVDIPLLFPAILASSQKNIEYSPSSVSCRAIACRFDGVVFVGLFKEVLPTKLRQLFHARPGELTALGVFDADFPCWRKAAAAIFHLLSSNDHGPQSGKGRHQNPQAAIKTPSACHEAPSAYSQERTLGSHPLTKRPTSSTFLSLNKQHLHLGISPACSSHMYCKEIAYRAC